jgi:hypothetical protein
MTFKELAVPRIFYALRLLGALLVATVLAILIDRRARR